MAAVMRPVVVGPPRDGVPLFRWLRGRLERGDPIGALPDQPAPGPDEVPWEPGALDGMMTHHAGVPETSERAEQLCALVVSATRRPTRRRLWRLHDALAEAPALEYVDGLLEALVEQDRVDAAALRELGLWLATCGTLRDPVKVGIGLVGIAGVGDARATLLTLGRHDEFTLFVAVALANTAEDPEGSLWELAQHVEGWGRIHAVERLATTRDPGIRAWLLREGYRNTVMNEYLAFVAATAGGLAEALDAPVIDDALRRGAADMIRALIAGGPAENLDDYRDGAAVVASYLRHVDPSRGTLGDFQTVAAIADHLGSHAGDWERRAALGWSATVRAWMEQRCRQILEHPRWWAMAVADLASDDEATLHRAHLVARRLGIATFELDLRRLRANPVDPRAWEHALDSVPGMRFGELIDLARVVLPLEVIASGPANDLGLGPEHAPHRCLSGVVRALGGHPGLGWDLIVAALRSPVTHNRNAAIWTLSAWGKDAWPPHARTLLEDVRHQEPEADTRAAIRVMLRSG